MSTNDRLALIKKETLLAGAVLATLLRLWEKKDITKEVFLRELYLLRNHLIPLVDVESNEVKLIDDTIEKAKKVY